MMNKMPNDKIDSVHYLDGMLEISRRNARTAEAVYGWDMPYMNCFYAKAHQIDHPDSDLDDTILLEEFVWAGSERSYREILIPYILPLTKGKAQLVFVWEDGDYFTGLEVNDGVVTEKDVKFTLVDKDHD